MDEENTGIDFEDEIQLENKVEDVTSIAEKESQIFTKITDPEVTSLHSKHKKGQLILQPDFQRQYVWDSAKASKLIESAISMVTLGRGNSVSKIFTGWLADLGVEEVTAKWLLNDDNMENGNLYGKITNFIYATYKMKDVDIKEKFETISAIYNKGLKGKEFFDEVLNQTGINLDAPSGKNEAAKKAIEIINSEF